MLLHNYYDFNYVLKQPVRIITQLLLDAKLKENEDKLYEQWVINHATEFSFKEFKEKIKEKIKEQQEIKIDKSKKKEEILKDTENILNQFRR